MRGACMLALVREVSTAVIKLVSRPTNLALKIVVKARLGASKSEASS